METRKYIIVSNGLEFELLSRFLRDKGFEWRYGNYSYESFSKWFLKDYFYIIISTDDMFIDVDTEIPTHIKPVDSKKLIKQYLNNL